MPIYEIWKWCGRCKISRLHDQFNKCHGCGRKNTNPTEIIYKNGKVITCKEYVNERNIARESSQNTII